MLHERQKIQVPKLELAEGPESSRFRGRFLAFDCFRNSLGGGMEDAGRFPATQPSSARGGMGWVDAGARAILPKAYAAVFARD
jgi:hypothetical protein